MGHYWSEMATQEEFAHHDAEVAAAIRKQESKQALHALGEYLAEHPERLSKLIEMVEER